jgi:hypothetical protein
VAAATGVLTTLAAVLAFGAVLPHAPRSFQNVWGFEPKATVLTAYPGLAPGGAWSAAACVLALRVTLSGACAA